MYKVSDFVKHTYKPGEAAKLIGVSTQTLINYEKIGKIKAIKTSGGHRLFLKEDVINYLDSLGLIVDDTKEEKKSVVYVSVSDNGEQPEEELKAELDKQALKIVETISCTSGNFILMKEIGSPYDDTRSVLNELLNMVIENKVDKIYVTDRSHLAKAGMKYLEILFELKGVEVVEVLN